MATNTKPSQPIMCFTALTILALGLFTLPGCLINSYSREYETGTHISQATLDHILPGTTTQDWVRSILGEPSRTDYFQPKDSDENGEIWVYEWQKTRSSSGSVIFIINSSSKKSQHATCYIEFVNDIVSRVWTDDS